MQKVPLLNCGHRHLGKSLGVRDHGSGTRLYRCNSCRRRGLSVFLLKVPSHGVKVESHRRTRSIRITLGKCQEDLFVLIQGFVSHALLHQRLADKFLHQISDQLKGIL